MNKIIWAVLSIATLLVSSILGCGGDEFTFSPGIADSGIQDSKPDKLPDAQQEPKPDVKHDVEAGQPDVKHEAEASVDAKPEAEAGPKDAGSDKEASPEAEPEVQPEAAPEAEVEAEASSPEAEPEAGPEASPEAEPEAEADVQPEAAPDVELPDVAQEDAVVLTDCQKYGKPGWATIVITVSDDPPAGKVLGVFGKYTFTVPDAGTPQDYTAWKFANPGEKMIIASPVAATVGLDITFEPGFTTSGNTVLTTWTYRCPTATSCPATDEYIVCVGDAYVGSYSGGVLHGNCETQLSANMIFQQLHCWQ
ncbi:MAG: hypothetical protein PHC53_01135 [Patescibacteria group bacterium]|nr:hypothetical protein [Patescibacteria group bacterium]